MNTFRLAEIAHHLASRERGRQVRNEVLAALASASRVVIDLSNVLSVSDSFADELFGVLAQTQGDAWFRQHIEIVAASDVVRGSIVRAIRTRLESAGRQRDAGEPRGYTLAPPPETLE